MMMMLRQEQEDKEMFSILAIEIIVRNYDDSQSYHQVNVEA